MSHLTYLLDKIISSSKEDYPFPDDLEAFLKDFFPDANSTLDTYQTIFKISNEDLEKVYQEGYIAYQQHAYENSASIFRWLIFFNPFITKFWLSLGSSLHMKQDYHGALHAYAVSALLEDTNPYPHYYAHLCYTFLNQPQEAAKALNIALQLTHLRPKYRELREEILNIQTTLNIR